MPTYDYECDGCGKSFELFQQMSDDPIKKCPECGGKVHRLIGSGAGVLLKGSSAQPDMPPRCQGCPQGGACSMQPDD